jgi:GT2 family glycosyltransferase
MLRFVPVAEPLVSVVIVTARDPERLLRCLDHVAVDAGAIPLEVVVVFNDPAPGLAETISAAVEGLVIVHSEVPLGFAGGANLGARHARGAFVGVLHDDAEVCDGWLAGLVDALEAHPEAGAAGSLILDLASGAVQVAGWVIWSDGRTEAPWREPAPPPAQSFRGVRAVDYCASSSLLVRRVAWEAAGGFDEDFHPAQYVDADFSMAMRRAGWTVILAPESRVRHAAGGTTTASMKRFAADRNRARFRAKWAEDLREQADYGDEATALERARSATLRRAEAVVEAPKAASAAMPGRDEDRVRDAGGEGEGEGEGDRLRREQRELRRDLEFKAAYIGHLEARADDAALEIAELRKRSDMLDTVFAGGWWRMRDRLLAVSRRLPARRRRSR